VTWVLWLHCDWSCINIVGNHTPVVQSIVAAPSTIVYIATVIATVITTFSSCCYSAMFKWLLRQLSFTMAIVAGA
jgi:hypothetical protein